MRLTAVFIAGLFGAGLSNVAAQTPSREILQPPAAFESINDPVERSRAIFNEIGKVLTHPRCMNCHPAGDRPLQGADHRVHFPPARRNSACTECHTDRNYTLHETASYQSIPGHLRWDLAPLSMAWEGKSLREICVQLKDKERNGGRDLALLHEHIAKDDLVAWGWDPGKGRESAPGSQELAGRLLQAWIDSGATCP